MLGKKYKLCLGWALDCLLLRWLLDKALVTGRGMQLYGAEGSHGHGDRRHTANPIIDLCTKTTGMIDDGLEIMLDCHLPFYR